MSDVIVAAAIAGGVGLAGNIVTYLATRKQADTSLATTREQSAHDLDRLAAEHREGERQYKRDTYRSFVLLLNEHDAWAQDLGEPRTRDVYLEWLARYRAVAAAVRLLDAPGMHSKLDAMMDVLGPYGNALFAKGTTPFEDRVGPEYVKIRSSYRDARDALVIATMREDISLR